MTRIVVIQKVRREVDMDVEFPVYSQHNMDNCTVFHRTELTAPATVRTLSVWIWDDGKAQLESEVRNAHGMDCDCLLGCGDYKSSAEAWNAALEKFKKAVGVL